MSDTELAMMSLTHLAGSVLFTHCVCVTIEADELADIVEGWRTGWALACELALHRMIVAVTDIGDQFGRRC